MADQNKFSLAGQSFHLPWSLEGVVRPESPSIDLLDLMEPFYGRVNVEQHSRLHLMFFDHKEDLCADDYAFSEEDYADDICSQKQQLVRSSVVGKTVRLPVALASEAVVFLLRLAWARPTAVHTDMGPPAAMNHNQFFSPYLQMAM